MLYSDYIYSQNDKNKSEYIEKLPSHINYLLQHHNLKQLYYGDSQTNCFNFQKLKKSHLNNLKIIFENSHNCLVIFKYFGYGFTVESSMIHKIPLLDKYLSGTGYLSPNYYIFNNHTNLFYRYDKIKGHQKGCQVIVLDLEIDLPFINLIFQVPQIIKYTSLNGCIYDNFLELLYYNLRYEYTKEDNVPKSLIFKYLRELISFLGINLTSFEEFGNSESDYENNMD